MIRGRVSEEGVPFVQLRLEGRDWTAVIDTGFNGYLELPEKLRTAVNAHFLERIQSLLAGGHLVEEDAYLVQFPFDSETIDPEATFSPGDEILIGTRLIRNYRLAIDFVRKDVLLERVGDAD